MPKSIDRTGAISSKRHNAIADKFKAETLDKSTLFKTKANSKLNNSTFIPNRGKWNKFRRRTQNDEPEEKLLCFEMVSNERLGISFQGFYSAEIKDRIKAIEGATYDSATKTWHVNQSDKDLVVEEVAQLVLDVGAKIYDVPAFVQEFFKYPIPMSASKRVKFGKDFNYEKEVRAYKTQ